MPFRGADVRHRLHGLVLGAQRGRQPLRQGTHRHSTPSGDRMEWLARSSRTSNPSAGRSAPPEAAASSCHSLRQPYPDLAEIKRARRNAVTGRLGRHSARCRIASRHMTVTATYEGTEIARSDRTVVVEGNHYFPAEDVLQGTAATVRHAQCLPVEGRSQLLRRRGGGAAAIPTPPGTTRPQGRGQGDRRPGGLLEGHHVAEG